MLGMLGRIAGLWSGLHALRPAASADFVKLANWLIDNQIEDFLGFRILRVSIPSKFGPHALLGPPPGKEIYFRE